MSAFYFSNLSFVLVFTKKHYMNPLLLIVDVQNYFLPDGEKGLKFSKEIELLQSRYDHIAISRFINSENTFWVKYLDWTAMMPGEESTNLSFSPAENAFIYDNSTFTSVHHVLLEYIRKHEISEVHICGVDTDACILATGFDLWDKQIHFKILIDHCISSAGDIIDSSAHMLMNKNFGFDIVVKSPLQL